VQKKIKFAICSILLNSAWQRFKTGLLLRQLFGPGTYFHYWGPIFYVYNNSGVARLPCVLRQKIFLVKNTTTKLQNLKWKIGTKARKKQI